MAFLKPESSMNKKNLKLIAILMIVVFLVTVVVYPLIFNSQEVSDGDSTEVQLER